jgi:hypothetical protein
VKANSEFSEQSGGHCSECNGRGRCAVGKSVLPRALSGPRFALAASGCFLLPLLFALFGALRYRSNAAAQLGGAVAGLALGMLCWWGLSRVLQGPTRAK